MDDISRNLEEDRDLYARERESRVKEIETERETETEERPRRSVQASSIASPRYTVRRTDAMYEDAYAANKVSQVIFYIAAVLSTLLGLRFLFQIFGARSTGFVNFIYQLTEPMVAPFRGIFGIQPSLDGTSRFEIETIVAIVAVVLLAYLLAGLVKVLSKSTTEA